MSLRELLNALRATVPGVAEGLGQLERFDRAAAQLPYDTFYEPPSVLEPLAKGRANRVELTPLLLEAWARHMAYTTRIRMRSFEPIVVREMLSGTSLGASTALRAHLEAGAMASLCLLTLNNSRTTDGLDKLAVLIPQTLFGTALFNKAKKNERVADMLTMAEQQTITICAAIRALDEFSYGDAANGSTEVLYALLCESAHPNHRGTRPFMTSEELDGIGWTIAYSPVEIRDVRTVAGIVDGLRLSMRGGYAASEMLRVSAFVDDSLPYKGTPLDEGERIWSTFLSPDA
jgi:hypothetical protein